MNGNMLLLLINHDTDMLLVWLPKERYDPIVWLIIKLNSDIIIRWYNKRKGKGSRRRFRIQSRLRLMDGTLFNASTTWFTCYDIQRQKGKIIIYCFYSYYFIHITKVYVIGGQEKERAGVEVYSIDLNQWTQLQTAPRIQYMAACGLANSKIFMIGGWFTDTGNLPLGWATSSNRTYFRIARRCRHLWLRRGRMGLRRSADTSAWFSRCNSDSNTKIVLE